MHARAPACIGFSRYIRRGMKRTANRLNQNRDFSSDDFLFHFISSVSLIRLLNAMPSIHQENERNKDMHGEWRREKIQQTHVHKEAKKAICSWACCLDCYNNLIFVSSALLRCVRLLFFFLFLVFRSERKNIQVVVQQSIPSKVEDNEITIRFFGRFHKRHPNAFDTWNQNRRRIQF